MKYIWSLLLALGFATVSFAQKEVKLEDISKYVGDSVVLTGKVYGGRFFPHSEGAPTLLNLGAAYPNQQLTVVIRGEARKDFPFVPEKDLVEKNVRVSGKVELYKDKPQVVVYSVRQLSVAEPAKSETGQ